MLPKRAAAAPRSPAEEGKARDTGRGRLTFCCAERRDHKAAQSVVESKHQAEELAWTQIEPQPTDMYILPWRLLEVRCYGLSQACRGREQEQAR